MIKSDEHTTCPYTLRAELKIYKKALEYACQDLDVKGIAFNRLPINQVMEWYLMKAETGGLDEAIETIHYLEAENALLRKVEEVGEIMWSEAVCHKCEARVCRGCAAHDFKKALSEYQSWKEGER